MSKIEWTHKTWNPVTGCTKISPGCKNCYAEVMTHRLQNMGSKKYKDGFRTVRTHEDELTKPIQSKKPKMIFVNSMSDLFHENVPDQFISKVFSVMQNCPQHIFEILTKRPYRLAQIDIHFTPNIWLGVSVENNKMLARADLIKKRTAKTKFLSCEPLLGPLPDLHSILDDIDWVIVGGESGHDARPMKKKWVLDIRDQCRSANIPFFFKQWGSYGEDEIKRSKKANGRQLNGKLYSQLPGEK